MKGKITKRSVESVKPGARDVFLWDTAIPGFGVKVTPRGKRVYVLQYTYGNRTRRYTIGRHGVDVTADQARTSAGGVRNAVKERRDPATERAAQDAMPTLAAFADEYMKRHAAEKKAPLSVAADRRNLDNHILPALGRRKVSEITRVDVAKFHAGMRERPGAGNRCLALLSKMFNLAEKWGYRPDGSNPTRHVEKYRERKIERYLSDAELARVGETLIEAARDGEHPSVVAAIRLLIFTGCRRNEILTLKWEQVDFERGWLWLPGSKTGARKVSLGAPALALLAGLPRVDGNPHVLPGAVKGRHYVGLEKAWRRLRERATVRLWAAAEGGEAATLVARLRQEHRREPTYAECRRAAEGDELELPAGLANVRLHDLRHTYASVGAAAGESLVLIGALLGHRNTATTARYAHLADDPVKAAADRISGRIAGAMRGDPGTVVPLGSRRK